MRERAERVSDPHATAKESGSSEDDAVFGEVRGLDLLALDRASK